jgi:TPR repeat protein
MSSSIVTSNFSEVRYRLGLETESENPELSKNWFLTAARSNHPVALFKQSQMLADTSHPASMLALFKSAENGFDEAQYQLGMCFQRGDGVSKDDNQSLKWLRCAAAQNHKKGQEKFASILMKFAANGDGEAAYELAGLHREGVGVKQSDAQCARWLEKAVSVGHVEAMMVLASMYDAGQCSALT